MVSSKNSLPAAMQFSPLLKNTELMPYNTKITQQLRLNFLTMDKKGHRTWTYHAHSLIHVTVTEDNERRLSSELQWNFLNVTDRTALDEREHRHQD